MLLKLKLNRKEQKKLNKKINKSEINEIPLPEGRGGVHYGQWKHFSEPIHGAFRNNRTINLLIHPRRASYCAIIRGFRFLVQNKLFSSFHYHFFCNALEKPLLTIKYYEFVLKVSEKYIKRVVTSVSKISLNLDFNIPKYVDRFLIFPTSSARFFYKQRFFPNQPQCCLNV